MVKPGFGGAPSRDDSSAILRAVWTPVSSSHAVAKVTTVLSFAESITSIAFKRLTEAVRSAAAADGLVIEEPVSTVTVALNGPNPTSTATEKVGIAFQKVEGGRPAQSLTLTPDGIRFESSTYIRWIGYAGQLNAYLGHLLPVVSASTTVKSIGLEYLDIFVALAEGEADAGLVIDRRSDLIVRQAFKRKEPFHSHCGWFETQQTTHRHLANVDVNVNDSVGPIGIRRTVMIRTHLAEQPAEELGQRATELTDANVAIPVLDELHQRLKSLLSSVLTRDAQAMISLRN